MVTEITAPLREYEYQYRDNALTHTDLYLRDPLLSILSEKAKSGAKILDLGCGNGSLSHVIAQQGYEVVGIEDSASGIAMARQNFPTCQFIEASIYDLPNEELLNTFDVVIAVEVIEHLMYPRELVRLAQKYLKPEGHLIITTPYHGYCKNLILALLGKMDSHFSPLWDGGHIKFFSVKTLTELLKVEGCKNINFKFAGRFPLFWKSMLCYVSMSKT